MIDFRKRVKELCAAQGITQIELARRMGITHISLNKTLRGEYPQLKTLENIANALCVDITELFNVPEQKAEPVVCPYCGTELRIKVE